MRCPVCGMEVPAEEMEKHGKMYEKEAKGEEHEHGSHDHDHDHDM